MWERPIHLDWLSSEQDKRRLYGPAYLLGNLSVTPGGTVCANREFSNFLFVVACMRAKIGGKECGRIFQFLWSDGDNLVGRPQIPITCRANRSLSHLLDFYFIFCRVHGPIDKLFKRMVQNIDKQTNDGVN